VRAGAFVGIAERDDRPDARRSETSSRNIEAARRDGPGLHDVPAPSENFEQWEDVMKRLVKAKRGKRATGKRVVLDPLVLFLPVLDLLSKAINAVSEAVESRDVELFRGKVSELRNACIVTELAMREPRRR
jgi:hypothetical protein